MSDTNKNQNPMRLRLLSTLACAVLLAACATNGPNGRRPPPGGEGGPGGPGGKGGGRAMAGGEVARPIGLLFTCMDTDNDYILTRAEFEAGITSEWPTLPKNASDMVTPIGFEVWSEQALGHKTTLPSRISFDTNLDGSITQEEFTSRLRLEFEELDKNKDGSLNRAELLTTLPSRGFSDQPQARGGQPPGGGRGDGQRPPPR